MPMTLHKDLREFIELLNSHKIDYLIVGAYALAYHGAPRYTGDIDVLIRPVHANAEQLVRALKEFGFASAGLEADDFTTPDQVVQLGFPPHRIDLLTSITGVDLDRAWSERVSGSLDGIPVNFLGRESLLENKRATGRTQDKADLEALGETE